MQNADVFSKWRAKILKRMYILDGIAWQYKMFNNLSNQSFFLLNIFFKTIERSSLDGVKTITI